MTHLRLHQTKKTRNTGRVTEKASTRQDGATHPNWATGGQENPLAHQDQLPPATNVSKESHGIHQKRISYQASNCHRYLKAQQQMNQTPIGYQRSLPQKKTLTLDEKLLQKKEDKDLRMNGKEKGKCQQALRALAYSYVGGSKDELSLIESSTSHRDGNDM